MSQLGSSSISAMALSGGTPMESPKTATACLVTSSAETSMVSAGGAAGGSGISVALAVDEGVGIGVGVARARAHEASATSDAAQRAILETFNFDSFYLGRCGTPK
jgi:hypothetical protein